jgi:hypothetical protein
MDIAGLDHIRIGMRRLATSSLPISGDTPQEKFESLGKRPRCKRPGFSPWHGDIRLILFMYDKNK